MERSLERSWSLGRVAFLWLALAVLTGTVYLALPRYIGSLERRIVFADPDCLDVASTRAQSAGVPVEVRGDSLEAWTKSCLTERRERMQRRADVVGWSTTVFLVLWGVGATLATAAWLWDRFSGPRQSPSRHE